MSDIYFFLPNIKTIYSTWYGPKSLKFDRSAQFEVGLDIYDLRWTWVKIQLCPNLGKGMLTGLKRKIYPFFGQSIENKKLHNIIKNQSIKSIRKGDMEDFCPFWPWKMVVPPLSPLQIWLRRWNLVCIFSRSLRCAFWGLDFSA